MSSKNSIKKTIRLNPSNSVENRILVYLDLVQDKKEGAFIKEALDLYIEFIENNLYNCPYLLSNGDVEELKESKFTDLVDKLQVKEEKSEENNNIGLFGLDRSLFIDDTIAFS